MPHYEFSCKKCLKIFDEIVTYDATGKYAKLKCPYCGSKKKDKLISMYSFQFTNPEGSDRWNSEATGHDYRFKHNIPKVKKEREMAEALSHMPNPYKEIDDLPLDTGIHDPESRQGLA